MTQSPYALAFHLLQTNPKPLHPSPVCSPVSPASSEEALLTHWPHTSQEHLSNSNALLESLLRKSILQPRFARMEATNAFARSISTPADEPLTPPYSKPSF